MESSDELAVIFSGACLITKAGETLVLCSAQEMIDAGLDEKIALNIAATTGSCSTVRKKKIDCRSNACSGTCKVFSAPRGPGPHEEQDEGIGPVTAAKNRFYWGRCV